MEEGMDYEKLEKLEEEKIEFDSNASEVHEGVCNECGGKLANVVENKNLLDGTLTFHIIKLRCLQCGKEYLDLNQAEKYDFLLILEQALRQKHSLASLSQKLSADSS